MNRERTPSLKKDFSSANSNRKKTRGEIGSTQAISENTAACADKKLIPGSLVVAAPRSLLADELRQRRQGLLQLLWILAGVTALAFAQAGTDLQEPICDLLSANARRIC
jgi:hypothetical protein